MNIINSILIFSIIIVIHELGHFLLAKKNGIFVSEFSVGMGPRIISLVKTEHGYRPMFLLSQHDFDTNAEGKNSTKYSLKLLPIGGSCMMMGEDENIDDERAFNNKDVWARISVILAGPLFNFILAFLLAIVVIVIGGHDVATIESVADNSSAQEEGIKKGDVITNINGKHINIGREFSAYLQFHPPGGELVTISYLREVEQKMVSNTVSLKPKSVKEYKLEFGDIKDEKPVTITLLNEDLEEAGLQIGDVILKLNDTTISNGSQLNQFFQDNPLSEQPVSIAYSRGGDIKTTKVDSYLFGEKFVLGFSYSMIIQKGNSSIFDVLKYSAVEVKFQIVNTVQMLGQLIAGKVSAKELAGPIGIVKMIGEVINNSEILLYKFLNALNFCILLSANLGVMNLLPIPALDGGRLVFLFTEVFRGKPIDKEKEGLVHMIGLVGLMILMVFVMFNDISRMF